MDLQTASLTLESMTPAMARSMIHGRPIDGDVWAPGYPMPDELDPVRMYLDSPSAADPFFGLYVIRLRSDRSAIGGIGFFGPPDGTGAVQFGYGLVPAVRGRGLATEAARALLLAAARRGATRAQADTRVDNFASQRVLLRLGLQEIRRDEELIFYGTGLSSADESGTRMQR